MHQRKTVLTLLLLVVSIYSHSQDIPFSNQYFLNRSFLSPSFAGSNSNYETFISHQSGWIGFEGAPQFSSVYISGPINEKLGLGGAIKRNVITIFNEFSANIDFAYHLKINENQNLHFGLSYEYIERFLDNKSNANASRYDPYLWENINSFNSAVSMVYSFKDFIVGIAIPRIFDSRNSNTSDRNSYKLSGNLRFYSSLLINFNHNLSLEPFLIIEKPDFYSFWYNLSTVINYKRMAWAELHYQSGDISGFGVGTRMGRRILVNYSHEFAVAGLMKASAGTHGLTLGILIGKNNNMNYHKSYFQSVPDKPYSNWVK